MTRNDLRVKRVLIPRVGLGEILGVSESIDSARVFRAQWIDLSAIDHVWIMTATALVLFMQAGFLLLEGGSVRSKNTINVAQKNITDLIVCSAIFFLIGGPIMFGLGSTGLFGFGGFSFEDKNVSLHFLYQLAFCATAATLISGAVSERMTFKGYVVLTVLMSAIIYPLFGHLVWGNALILNNPAFLADHGFKDYAGSTVVHVIGGAAALAAIIKLGPRQGRYDAEGNLQKIRGHSSLLANLGVMILVIGWVGFNGGAARPGSNEFSSIVLNTIAALSFGGLAGVLHDISNRTGVFHPRSARNGILGGLVAITAGCAFVELYGAMVIGFIGGMSAVFSSNLFAHKMRWDDPVDVVAVHMVAGVVGTILVAFLAQPEILSFVWYQQVLIQLAGVTIASVWAFGVTWITMSLAGKFMAFRVSPEEEEIGLNITEHDDEFDIETMSALLRRKSEPSAADLMKSDPVGEEIDESVSNRNRGLSAMAKIVEEAKKDQMRMAQQKSEISHLSTKDHLTGLLNRTSFQTETTEKLKKNKQLEYAILYLDLDGFKSINDSFGHGVGDTMLQEISKRIKKAAGEKAVIARFGGDEFVVLLPLPKDDLQHWKMISMRLIRMVSDKISIQNLELYVGLSVGVALCPYHNNEVDNLLRLADMALYEAKAEGKGRFVLFEPVMQARAERRKQLEIDMRAGISRDEFHTVYQPQYETQNNTVIGFEALMRWEHPIYGQISPAEFIPIAEETGLIVELSERLIRTACRAATQWPTVHGKPCQLGVNISPIQFLKLDVCGMLKEVLRETGLKPSLLEIEITESTLIQDMAETTRVLNEIRQLGIKIAIDDFGTGYSSLNYLQKFPIDRLKVDKSFISEITSEDDEARIIETILQLGKSLGLSVIAEGVETQLQHDKLNQMNCDQVQGFLFSPPVSLAGAVSIICDANSAAGNNSSDPIGVQQVSA